MLRSPAAPHPWHTGLSLILGQGDSQPGAECNRRYRCSGTRVCGCDCGEPHEDRGSVGRGGIVARKFEVYKDSAGKFRFRLKARNGQIIATGEAYETKAGALRGIESVRKNAGDAPVDDQTAD